MNLRVATNKKTERTYLSIVKGYRDKTTGKSRATTVQSLGYLDELQKQYPDPIAHFREVAQQMTEAEMASRKITLTLDKDEELSVSTDLLRNIGYAAILRIYHELGLQRFFDNTARNRDFQFNTNSIMSLLVISRILSPGSKKKAFDERDRYFERFDFSLADLYRSLAHFAGIAKETQRHLNERVREVYGRDTTLIYYDVTNYYFEINEEDDLRKRGVSKENRKDPIIQMGLAMDANGIPLSYELFPGNTVDTSTFRPAIGEILRNYDAGRVIVVADGGFTSGDNAFYLTGGEKREQAQHGYVFSYSIRGATQEFQQFVTDENGYHALDGSALKEGADFMVKSRWFGRSVNVTMQDGKTKKKIIYEKQVVFWSRKYAERAKAEREAVLRKAQAIAADPAKYSRATSYGAAKYLRNIAFDKKTGEIIQPAQAICIDEDKIKGEERFDGYYAIVTSEAGMSEAEVIKTYRGLWEIEETFRISKGSLETRPIYVSREDSIQAHFLSCFISLLILRLLQKQTDQRLSCDVLVDCLNRLCCTNVQGNLYQLTYRSEVSDAIGSALNIDFTKKWMQLDEIKGLIASIKKPSIPVKKRNRKRRE